MFACVDCHKDVKGLVHETTPQKVTCAECHAEAQQAYAHSLHAKAKPGAAPAANCQDCHGGAHEILAADDAKSPVNHDNIPVTCGRCHGQKFLMESNGESAQTFISYQESVHGLAIEKGSKKAAVCTDCHGAHEILPANDAKSPIYKFNVPATCGKCHARVDRLSCRAFTGRPSRAATGWPRCARTATESTPSRRTSIPTRRSPSRTIARTTCARCHEGVRLSQEFGVPGNRVIQLLGQLSRAGRGGRLGGGGQLRQLPRRA